MSAGRPRHVLLDADGVVQRSHPDPFEVLGRWAGPRVEELGRALWEAERGPLRGEGDFLEAVARVVPSYADADPVALYETLWHHIEVSPESLALVAALREAGLGVHLGTNQHRQRGERMRTVLGFDRLFDVSCYSWEMGTKKPEAAYFETAVERIGAAPDDVVFVDDLDANVEAAREVGLRAFQWHLDQGHDVLRTRLAEHGLDL